MAVRQKSAGTLRQLLGGGGARGGSARGSGKATLGARLGAGIARVLSAKSGKSGKHDGADGAEEEPRLDPALRQLIEGLRLGASATAAALRAAAAWAEREGADTVADIGESGAEAELAAELNLKPKKKVIFLKRLAALAARGDKV